MLESGEDPPGKTTVKSPEDADLSEPKSKTHTAGSPEALSLNIKAPLAVSVTVPNNSSAKSVIAVVPEAVGVTLVRGFPFAL